MRGDTFVALGVVAAIWSGCGDDVVRAAGKSADEILEISRYGDEVVIIVRGSDELAQVPLATRIRQIADEFEVPAELKEEWDGLVSDFACGLATGEISVSVEGLTDLILVRGVLLALDIQGDVAADLAGKLIEAHQDPTSGDIDLCDALPAISTL